MNTFEPAPHLALASSPSADDSADNSSRASPSPGEAADEGGRAATEPALGRDAFQDFYERTSAPLRRYLLRVAGDPALAEDVFQESYVRLINHAPRQVENRRAYLFRIATNLLRDHWRRRTREHRGLRDLVANLGKRTARPTSGDAIDLESALAELAPRERAMLWLAYVEGYRHREIASMLGVRTGSVKVLLHRLRRRLAQRLDPHRETRKAP